MKRVSKKLLVALTILGISLSGILILFFLNQGKIIYGLQIANFKIGGDKPALAQKNLLQYWNFFSSQKITFILSPHSSIQTSLRELGFELNANQTIEEAFKIGHQGNFFRQIKEQITALFGFLRIKPSYQIGQTKFQNKTREIFQNFESPAQDATLVYYAETDEFVLQPAQEGKVIDRIQLLNHLSRHIDSFSLEPIKLSLIPDYPRIENDEVAQAKERANHILKNQPYYLKFEETYKKIDKKTLLKWIKFKPIPEKENPSNEILGFSLDYAQVEKYLDQFASFIDRPPTNAQLEIKDGRALNFVPDSRGFEVKRKQTFNRFIKNLLSEPSIKTTEIIADITYPKITLAQLNDLGINNLIGEGVSNFAGSPSNRIHNIKITVAKLNGLILKPNEEFSFNASLGKTGPEEGYLPELVIKNHKITPEYGGGVCQVSTTFFRAAIKSGLKITERHPHSFPIEYYGSPGFDATVYDPQPDLKFINNTPAHLLIQAYIQGYNLIVRFYGTKDGRKVKVRGPFVVEKKEDGSLKTVLYQEVYKNSEPIIQDAFYSFYQPSDSFTRN